MGGVRETLSSKVMMAASELGGGGPSESLKAQARSLLMTTDISSGELNHVKRPSCLLPLPSSFFKHALTTEPTTGQTSWQLRRGFPVPLTRNGASFSCRPALARSRPTLAYGSPARRKPLGVRTVLWPLVPLSPAISFDSYSKPETFLQGRRGRGGRVVALFGCAWRDTVGSFFVRLSVRSFIVQFTCLV